MEKWVGSGNALLGRNIKPSEDEGLIKVCVLPLLKNSDMSPPQTPPIKEKEKADYNTY